MSQTYALSDKSNERVPCDKVYVVVFGLLFAFLLGTMGGTMAYLSWAYEGQEGRMSAAEGYGIPTWLLSLVLLGCAAGLLLIAICAMFIMRCDFSKPGIPRNGNLCTEAGTESTQVLTLSRETITS